MAADKSTDRRVARTHLALRRALLTLMLEKGYTAVTVEDICREADVGRSTFYSHFTGKEDLKRSSIDHNLRRMLLERQRKAHLQSTAAKEKAFRFALDFFQHAGDHLDLHRALVAKGGSEVTFSMLRSMLADLVRAELIAQNGKAADPQARELTIQFIVGGFLAMLTWWLDGGAKAPAEKLDAVFRRLVTDGVLT